MNASVQQQIYMTIQPQKIRFWQNSVEWNGLL